MKKNEIGCVYKGCVYYDGDGLYLGTSPAFTRGGLHGISRCLKAEMHDVGVCILEEIKDECDTTRKYSGEQRELH